MHIVMAQTITDSINEGRTRQEFFKGAPYQVPDEVGQLWIGRGWATAASAAVGETSGTRQQRPVAPVAPKRGKE